MAQAALFLKLRILGSLKYINIVIPPVAGVLYFPHQKLQEISILKWEC
jgi:hypothetical protein